MIFFYDFPLYYDQVSHQFWYQTEVDIIVIPFSLLSTFVLNDLYSEFVILAACGTFSRLKNTKSC